jgi:hypothetical protein
MKPNMHMPLQEESELSRDTTFSIKTDLISGVFANIKIQNGIIQRTPAR